MYLELSRRSQGRARARTRSPRRGCGRVPLALERVDHACSQRFVQRVEELLLGSVAQRLEDGKLERAGERRGDREQVHRSRRQPPQARAHGLAHALGHTAAVPALAEVANDLGDEERIARGLAPDLARELRRERRTVQELDQRRRFAGSFESSCGGEAPVLPPPTRNRARTGSSCGSRRRRY